VASKQHTRPSLREDKVFKNEFDRVNILINGLLLKPMLKKDDKILRSDSTSVTFHCKKEINATSYYLNFARFLLIFVQEIFCTVIFK